MHRLSPVTDIKNQITQIPFPFPLNLFIPIPFPILNWYPQSKMIEIMPVVNSQRFTQPKKSADFAIWHKCHQE